MRLLTALLSCLLSLFGCDTRPSTTHITRIVDEGAEALFSKTTWVDGTVTFECFASRTGDCHYRVYEDVCEAVDAAAGDPSSPSSCRERTLDAFALAVGGIRRVEGLPDRVQHCVAERDDGRCG